MSAICEEPYCEKPLGHDGACGQANAPDRTARLVAALRGLVSAVSARLARGEDTTPGDFDRAWREACETLKESEPESAHALSCNARRLGSACNCALGRVTP